MRVGFARSLHVAAHLFFEATKDSEIIDVTIASLDDPAPLRRRKRSGLKTSCRGSPLTSRCQNFRKAARVSNCVAAEKMRLARTKCKNEVHCVCGGTSFGSAPAFASLPSLFDYDVTSSRGKQERL